MNYFMGMKRRAKKCLWFRLKWRGGVLVRAADGCGTFVCAKLTISEREPAQMKELDYDEEFRHLGYTASPWGTSDVDVAMPALHAVARRMTLVFHSKPPCSAAEAEACLHADVHEGDGGAAAGDRTGVQPHAPPLAVVRPAVPVGRSHRHDGAGRSWSRAGVHRGDQGAAATLPSDGNKPHCRRELTVLALARSGQRWAGARRPVNVLSQDQVHLFEPLGSSAAKLYHARLATEVRTELWAGRESGELICGCGHRLKWSNRDQVDQLQSSRGCVS